MKNHTKRGKLNVVEWKSYKRVKREVSALTLQMNWSCAKNKKSV